jgi:hypothetical protein
MYIKNDRKGTEYAGLYGEYWEGMKSDNYGYPKKGR